MTTLRLGGVHEAFNFPIHLAMASESIADLDLDLTWTDQTGGTGQMLESLANGEIDVVSILTEGTVLAIDRGAELTILQVLVESPLRWGMFVPEHSSFETPESLVSPRIAISRFRSGSHLMSFVLAEQMGWTLTDDQFVVVGNLDGAREAFANGDADLFLWDRYTTQFLVDAGEFRRVGLIETPWAPFVLAARNEIIAEHGDQLTRLVDEITSQAVAMADRPEIVDELLGRYELTEETARAWLAATSYAERGAPDPAALAETLATLERAGFAD